MAETGPALQALKDLGAPKLVARRRALALCTAPTQSRAAVAGAAHWSSPDRSMHSLDRNMHCESPDASPPERLQLYLCKSETSLNASISHSKHVIMHLPSQDAGQTTIWVFSVSWI